MKTVKPFFCAAAWVLLLCCIGATLPGQATYEIIDLGTLGGRYSRANAVNEKGEVVGISEVSGDVAHAFLWLPSAAYGLPAGMNDLGTLGGQSSEARDINNRGQVVGWSHDSEGQMHAFLWEMGEMILIDLDALGQCDRGFCSQANAINDEGVIVGRASTDIALRGNTGFEQHAFRSFGGAMQALGALDGSRSEALDINNAGQITGYSRTKNIVIIGGIGYPETVAVLWEGDAINGLECGRGPGNFYSSAVSISEAGPALVSTGNFRNFLFAEGKCDDQGSYQTLHTEVRAVNSLGHIVGKAEDDQGKNDVAFLRIGSRNVNLFSQLEITQPWIFLEAATDISDRGDIVGYGRVAGDRQRAFLLSSPGGTAAVEGGVREFLMVSSLFADTSAVVTILPPGEDEGPVADDVRFYPLGNDRVALYFTPPPFREFTGEKIRVDVRVATHQADTLIPGALLYTTDAREGIRAVRHGLYLFFEELLLHQYAQPLVEGPKKGGIAEVILFGIFSRSFSSPALYPLLEDFLPRLADQWNTLASGSAGYQAVVRSVTDGQVLHRPARQREDVVLLHLGTGTLTLTTNGEGEEESSPLSEGRFLFSGDLDETGFFERVVAADAHGWEFEIFLETADPEIHGVQIRDLRCYSERTDSLQLVARRLSLPAIELGLSDGPVYVKLEKDFLSHIYINRRVPGPGTSDDDGGVVVLLDSESGPDTGHELEEWILTAVYRINLDGTVPRDNHLEPALVVRQSYAFSHPFTDFEPTGCLRSAHVYPQATFYVSSPDPEATAGEVSHIRADHRFELAPQGTGEADAYVAGLFQDLDIVQYWLPFPFCVPLPIWINIFNPEGTLAPVKNELLFASASWADEGIEAFLTDNIHLHHVHDPSSLCWGDVDNPITEAPGSFDGTIHLHWRWGADFGPDFGGGAVLLPPRQRWILALTDPSFPIDPEPDFLSVMQERLDNNDGPDNLYLSEKVLLVGCRQEGIEAQRQYESMSTGFSFAVGAAEDLFCKGIDLITQNFGYWLLTLGFDNTLGELAFNTIFNTLGIFDREKYLEVCEFLGPRVVAPAPVVRRETPLCAEFVFPLDGLGQRTPLSISTPLGDVHFEAGDQSDRYKIWTNIFTLALGNALAEQPGPAGNVPLVLRFDQAVRQIRHLPFAISDSTAAPPRLAVDPFMAGQPLPSLRPEARFLPGVLYAQGTISIDPGQPFDRLVLAPESTTGTIGIGGFQVCSQVIQTGDLDYDGDVDLDDFFVLKDCYRGAAVRLGLHCTDPDLDGDQDVDCEDVSRLNNLAGGLAALGADCNHNGIADGCEIAAGLLPDENRDGIPDACPQVLMARIETVMPVRCHGDRNGAATVSVSGGAGPPYTHLWSTGDTSRTVFGLPAGQVSVVVADAAGARDTLLVTIPQPDPIVVTVDSLFPPAEDRSNGAVFISVKGGSGPPYFYEWFQGEELFSTEEDADSLGRHLYRLVVRDSVGCASDTMRFNLGVTKVSDASVVDQLRVFPNPASEVIRVSLVLNRSTAIDLVLFDATGRLLSVQRSPLSGKHDLTVDVASLPTGVYWIKIVVGEAVLVERVVVE